MAKITSITQIDTPEYVYDPVCPAPHAYVSNGFVSHNCDEIDKGLGGIGGSNDSGVSNRVLGSFLTWLQDCKKPVFVMVTANNVTGLPPEMLRRGRFDAIFSTTMPTSTERKEVLKIHLRLRGRNIRDFPADEVAEVVSFSEGYVPAEIESAVKDGLVDAFSSGEDLTMGHVITALKSMVPLSVAFAEKINQMAAWAEKNATPAGKPEGDSPAVATGNARRISSRRRK
jgi:SpoVK/Ycf46/Vps4 family AAA+-type ATPase